MVVLKGYRINNLYIIDGKTMVDSSLITSKEVGNGIVASTS